MERFRNWRKMTWVLLAWGAGALVFIVANGFGLSAIGIAALGFLVLGFIWYMSRPPWRVGHGARVRQLQSVEIPFKQPKSATQD